MPATRVTRPAVLPAGLRLPPREHALLGLRNKQPTRMQRVAVRRPNPVCYLRPVPCSKYVRTLADAAGLAAEVPAHEIFHRWPSDSDWRPSSSLNARG